MWAHKKNIEKPKWMSILRGKHSKMASITRLIMSKAVVCDNLCDIALRKVLNPNFAVNGWAGSELKGEAPLLEKSLWGFFVGLFP